VTLAEYRIPPEETAFEVRLRPFTEDGRSPKDCSERGRRFSTIVGRFSVRAGSVVLSNDPGAGSPSIEYRIVWCEPTPTIRTRRGAGWTVSAIDEEAGVASQNWTRSEVLASQDSIRMQARMGYRPVDRAGSHRKLP